MINDKLLLIDGFNLLSRGYFATAYGKTPEQLTKNQNGQYTNALRVFLQKLFNLTKEHNISHLVVAWDVKREELSRRKEYEFYKAQRNELPSPLIQQYETLTVFLNNIGVSQLTVSPYEADDIIGTLANHWNNESIGNCFIYSNDKDLFQLLSPQTSQITSQKKTEIIYTLDLFKEEFNIDSNQWVDVKALLGDTSDNIPGCPGIGEKSALPLIQQYGSLEGIYNNIENLDTRFNRYKKKLIEGETKALLSKELSTIICDIEELQKTDFNNFRINISNKILYEELNNLELRIKI
ncbi:5'-3' exonuclease [Solibacillus cecembensis]|uniref:5'-3' exonuclease n=1 Tax=Solibacillus cecembensis TaxID=459347 RepID=UPI003D09574E